MKKKTKLRKKTEREKQNPRQRQTIQERKRGNKRETDTDRDSDRTIQERKRGNEREIDRDSDRETDRQTGRQAGRHVDRQTLRQRQRNTSNSKTLILKDSSSVRSFLFISNYLTASPCCTTNIQTDSQDRQRQTDRQAAGQAGRQSVKNRDTLIVILCFGFHRQLKLKTECFLAPSHFLPFVLSPSSTSSVLGDRREHINIT